MDAKQNQIDAKPGIVCVADIFAQLFVEESLNGVFCPFAIRTPIIQSAFFLYLHRLNYGISKLLDLERLGEDEIYSTFA